GWSPGHTVVEIITNDMPFLVDSVAAELTREGRAIHVVFHPQLVVRRTITGHLVELCDPAEAAEAATPPQDAAVESWIHVEIDRDVLEEIQGELIRVVGDVREVVEDWQKMRAVALDIADSLAAGDGPVPPAETAEAVELLRWLADDHFTFIGYREYDLVTDD